MELKSNFSKEQNLPWLPSVLICVGEEQYQPEISLKSRLSKNKACVVQSYTTEYILLFVVKQEEIIPLSDLMDQSNMNFLLLHR